MVEKVDLSLIKTDADGEVYSGDGGLNIREISDDTLSGNFDRLSGTLVLNIPNIGKVSIPGFTTPNDIGLGPIGPGGEDGRDGIDGLSGSDGGRGSDGCPGPRGNDGLPGRQGVRGSRGNIGPTGATGATGPSGKDGVVAVFIQATDPSLDRIVEPGSIWVRTSS
ncbi:tail fiber protein [Dickeya phage vB_DsoM_JA29]|uniref:Putative tail fiber protein n=1 Tax=Dickeya phage vB_DsoM_JA29 TaxID=2283031 RepID=A0A384ZX30_9CAUD|nr:tail fiber protein [Dickeya phage vB_DsoM_JA29]AXG66823.1 putative tail fiber protein [Dickeya phage vB_DsoM_JA29]